MKEKKVFKILMIIFWALTILLISTILLMMPLIEAFGRYWEMAMLLSGFFIITGLLAIVFTILYLVKRHRLKKESETA